MENSAKSAGKERASWDSWVFFTNVNFTEGMYDNVCDINSQHQLQR